MPFYSTLIPLVGVLGVTAVKDAYDDIVRHKKLLPVLLASVLVTVISECEGWAVNKLIALYLYGTTVVSLPQYLLHTSTCTCRY